MNIPTAGSAFSDGQARAGIVVLTDVAHDAQRVRRFIENDLGWHVVDRVDAALLPPQVIVTDRFAGEAHPASVLHDLPTVRLVHDSATPAAGLDATTRPHGAASGPSVGSLTWPTERARLEDLVVATLGRAGVGDAHARMVRVVASRRGIGATTVTLALAGIAGWSGQRVVAYAYGHTPVRGMPQTPVGYRQESGAQAGPVHRGWHVDGAGDLTVVAVATSPPAVLPMDGSADLVLCETGPIDQPATCVPDGTVPAPDGRALFNEADIFVVGTEDGDLRLATVSEASIIVVVGSAPGHPQVLTSDGGARLWIRLGWSARVARCVRQRAVPVGLPGRWLLPLRHALRHLDRLGGRPGPPSPPDVRGGPQVR